MAFTGTLIRQNVVGDERMAHYDVTADALSGAVATSLGYITAAYIGPVSMATAAITVVINKNAAGSAANGSVHLSGCVNGDHFYLHVYGRS